MTDLNRFKAGCDCGCEIEWRKYETTRQMQCTLHRADGSTKNVPLREATIEEMVASGKQPAFWAKRRERQLQEIAQAEAAVAEAEAAVSQALAERPAGISIKRSIALGKGAAEVEYESIALARAKQGKVKGVCPAGCVYMPGTRVKGHLVHRCEAHKDLDDDNLQTQRWHKPCGCVVDQITTGEGRSGDKIEWLEQTVDLCPLHGGSEN